MINQINHNHNHNHQRRQNDLYYLESKDAYLLCLHVKPTTIFCGFIILIMSFMNIIILLSKFTVDFNLDKDTATVHHVNLDPRFRTNKLIILYIIAESLKFLISGLLIYGVMKSRSSYLIPFFLMQLFYFFKSVSFFLESYANYQQSLLRSGSNNELMDMQKKDLPPQSYPILVFFFTLLYKLYFITCVFKCYKYIKLKEATFHVSQIQFHQHQQPVNATISVLHNQTSPPSYHDCITITKDEQDNQKLPSYDEACKIQVQETVKNESNNGNVANNGAINPSETTKSTNNTLV